MAVLTLGNTLVKIWNYYQEKQRRIWVRLDEIAWKYLKRKLLNTYFFWVYFSISYFIEILVKIVLFSISKPQLMYFVHVSIDFHYSRKFRSSHPELFLVKSALEKCSKFTGEYPCQSVTFIEVILRYEWSPVNLLHIFRTPFTNNTCRLLLLKICTGALFARRKWNFFKNILLKMWN